MELSVTNCYNSICRYTQSIYNNPKTVAKITVAISVIGVTCIALYIEMASRGQQLESSAYKSFQNGYFNGSYSFEAYQKSIGQDPSSLYSIYERFCADAFAYPSIGLPVKT